MRSYVRFDIQGLAGHVSNATLRVFANDALPAGFEVRSVSNDTWGETTITYNNAPAMSPAATNASGPIAAGAWHTVDVTSLVGGSGQVTLGLATSSATLLGMGSRESATPPELIVTTVGGLTVVSRSGNTYLADSQSGGPDYSGPQLKVVVENAMHDLDNAGGGLLSFQAGTFDLGADHLQLTSISNVTFDGQGIDVTNVVNNTNVLQDTEPFSSLASDHITIRNMTISAGGSLRETSDDSGLRRRRLRAYRSGQDQCLAGAGDRLRRQGRRRGRDRERCQALHDHRCTERGGRTAGGGLQPRRRMHDHEHGRARRAGHEVVADCVTAEQEVE